MEGFKLRTAVVDDAGHERRCDAKGIKGSSGRNGDISHSGSSMSPSNNCDQIYRYHLQLPQLYLLSFLFPVIFRT